MIEEAIKKDILSRIKSAEKEHNVKILFAIESGSRAWGFASPNSDYDVRFIYAHPKEWYLSVDLEYRRDVIEYPIVDEIDINGWDVRKALKLFCKSNPAFVEWIQSPIVYVDDNYFAKHIRSMLPSIYSIERGIYHYRSMAKTNYREHLIKESVSIKKYFYVLRPLFAIWWLEKYREPAPIEFNKLTTLIEGNQTLSKEISELLERKKVSMEKEKAPPIPILNEFIESELKRLEGYNDEPKKNGLDYNEINTLFNKILDSNNF